MTHSIRFTLAVLLGSTLGCTAPGTDAADSGDTLNASTGAGATTEDLDTGTTPSTADTTLGTTSPATSDSDATGDPDPITGDSSGGPIEPGADFRERGPHTVQIDPGQFPIGGGCTMAYDTFSPDDIADAPTVILAHGFQGNRASMAGWADHWASWGLRVVTPNLCHATIIDTDHAQNGADIAALVDHLGVGPVALAGYSAGGLAAVIAAAARPDTIALLGLDMVDSGGLGAQAAASVSAPAHDLVAEPAMCNSTSNGVPVFAAIPDSNTVRLIEADHCDFQNPGDMFCNLCAANNTTHTPETIQAAILGLTTAALMWRLGVDDTGTQWWIAGGAYYDEMFLAGVLAQL